VAVVLAVRRPLVLVVAVVDSTSQVQDHRLLTVLIR
jgi:hypothetical protein